MTREEIEVAGSIRELEAKIEELTCERRCLELERDEAREVGARLYGLYVLDGGLHPPELSSDVYPWLLKGSTYDPAR